MTEGQRLKSEDRRFQARDRQRGVALIVVLLTMVLLTALGMALTLVTSTESRVASAYRDASEAFYAADAMMEQTIDDVSDKPDWNLILDGSVRSVFTDGAPGVRILPDGTTMDLRIETALVSCGKAACNDADLNAVSSERPWGENNPRWQLYAHGPLSAMAPDSADSRHYVVAWIADDLAENDRKPLLDGDTEAGENPGRHRLSLLARAYGPGGTGRAIEGTLSRGDSGPRLLSWREVR